MSDLCIPGAQHSVYPRLQHVLPLLPTNGKAEAQGGRVTCPRAHSTDPVQAVQRADRAFGDRAVPSLAFKKGRQKGAGAGSRSPIGLRAPSPVVTVSPHLDLAHGVPAARAWAHSPDSPPAQLPGAGSSLPNSAQAHLSTGSPQSTPRTCHVVGDLPPEFCFLAESGGVSGFPECLFADGFDKHGRWGAPEFLNSLPSLSCETACQPNAFQSCCQSWGGTALLRGWGSPLAQPRCCPY